jgi:hypothetical protein
MMEPIRAAVVKDGIVTNIIAVESLNSQADLQAAGVIDGILVECPVELEGVGPGASYDEASGEFTPLPPEEPLVPMDPNYKEPEA